MKATSTRVLRNLAVSVLIAVLFGVGGSGSEASAQTANQLYGPFNDGCYYWWDASVGGYTHRYCPISKVDIIAHETYWEIYLPSSGGQWGLWGTLDYNSDSSYSLEDVRTKTLHFFAANGTYLYSQSTDNYGRLGGLSTSSLTGNLVVDQILINHNNALIDTIFAPNCVETIGNICYTN